MGGDLGTLFCSKYSARAVSFVNIEGDLTPEDRFITNKAIETDRDGRFEQWLRSDFACGIVVSWAEDWPSCVRYLASLQLCAPSAFLASAKQIYDLNAAAPDSDGGIIGVQYLRLSLSKVFCWSSESLSSGSKAFLTNNKLLHQPFPNTFHWVMLDSPQAFYGFLTGFIAQNRYTA